MTAANYAMAAAAAVEIYSMTNDEGALRQRRRRHWSTVHIGYKAGDRTSKYWPFKRDGLMNKNM